MRYLNITSPDIENGLGFRVTLWISGCKLNCPGCHNPESHSFLAGKVFDNEAMEELLKQLNRPYIKGLTLSGGNPLDSDINDLLQVVKRVKGEFPDKDIWLYSGYTLDEINSSDKKIILDYIDVLVDGPFKQRLANKSLAFRGSSNQIIWKKENGLFIKSEIN